MIRSIYTFLAGICIVMTACNENQPQYELIQPSTGDRTILVEEFSGALCPNCPQGTQELDNLKSIYGDQIVIVTVHAGDFAFQYEDSKYDFTTQMGDELLQILGNPIGYPSAVINRKRDGQFYQSFSTRWSSLISEALEEENSVTISGNVSYEPASRSLLAVFRALPLQNLEGILKLSVLIKEDKIVDPQADRAASTGKVADYVHKNVLRIALSSPSGDVLGTDPLEFQPLEREYSFTLPAENGWWVDTNCQIVAFLTLENGSEMEVVQAMELPLAE